MQVILRLALLFLCVYGADYRVIPAPSKKVSQNQISPKITPPPASQAQRAQGNLNVKVKQPPKAVERQTQPLQTQIKSQNLPLPSSQTQPSLSKIKVIPPSSPQTTPQKPEELKVKVYPPVMGIDPNEVQNLIKSNVSPSRPITQDMMFQKQNLPKRKLPPPRRRKAVQNQPQVIIQPQVIDEYEGEDLEPLFVRNRNGVMIGGGVGGSFDRMWVQGDQNNQRYYDEAFSFFFRLGYQHYFTHYLGVRAYAHLGDWSNSFVKDFNNGGVNVVARGKLNFNYSFFAEVLYDFVVLRNHSFGVFGGFGIGVSYGEFQNDDTQTLQEYFAMPALSLGFAYTLFENNRFELEFKVPLRTEILQKDKWRTELSTWLLGVSYTYIF